MYIDISSVDELMKSTIEQELFLKNKKNKNYSASFYILEKAAKEMLDHVINKKQKSADIAEKAAAAMLAHVNKRKQTFGDLEIIQSIS
jgi:cell division septum initiation protein DivIVA